MAAIKYFQPFTLVNTILHISYIIRKSWMLLLVLLLNFNTVKSQASDFVTRWDLSKTGTAGNNSISFFTTNAAGSISYTWQEISPGSSSGSGSFSAGTATSRSITGLPTNAIIELRIAATNLQTFSIEEEDDTDGSRLIDVTQWGSVAWTSMKNMFVSCYNLNITATDLPDLTQATSMSYMFGNCSILTGPTNIGSWNTSNVTNMASMFSGATAFNQNIGSWNTSNVKDMTAMFYGATAFNQNIGSWNTSNVTNMEYMFSLATAFNQNIGSWNTSNVTNMAFMFFKVTAFNQNIGSWNTSNVINMGSMFSRASAFNQNIGSWNTANVTRMEGMFYSATAFNQNIGSWNTANVTHMSVMFSNATAFNQNIGNWNTANVTYMSAMFQKATAFNQNIGSWNTANVTHMSVMFSNATAFNQNIGNWNTANVVSMDEMFKGATAFNQNIGSWNTANVIRMDSMFKSAAAFNQNLGNWQLNNNVNIQSMLDNCGMNCENYSLTLAGWANTTTATGRSLSANGLTYGTNVVAFRNILTSSKGWTITGDAVSAGTCGPTAFYSKSTGNLDDLATWGTNTDGSGTNPSNFTNANQLFSIRNRSTASIASSWTVSGSNSMVIIGDAIAAITVSTGNNNISGNFKLTNNTTLEISSSNANSLNLICENGSTVDYNASGAQSIAKGNYYNLNISNNRSGASITLSSGTIEVRNDFTLTATNIGSWIYTGNTFVYCGSGAQTVAAIDYNNLIISGFRNAVPTITLASGTTRVYGNAYLSAFNDVNWINTGNNFEYPGSAGQQIGAYYYNNLSISGNKNNGLITLEYGTIGDANSVSVTATNISGWTNNGNIFNYYGSNAQTIAPEIVYNNLTISGSNNKTLGGNTLVQGNLALSNKLILSQYHFTLNGNVIGANSSNYVQTNGTGTFKKTIAAGIAFAFPVGNSSYNPASITNNTGTADLFAMRILDEVYYQGTSGFASNKPRVKRTWLIDKTNPNTGSGIDLIFNWNAGEATAGISAYKLYHYEGSEWQKQTGTTSTVDTSLTYTGYTGSFSPFSIGDDIVLLPVSWLYMRCNNSKADTNNIQWATASESNSRSFVVERSSNGKTFFALDSVAAAGNSSNINHYSYVDVHATEALTYYRIKQVDENGSEHLSEVCVVKPNNSEGSPLVSVYPNPAESVVFISAGENSQSFTWMLYNATGQQVALGSSVGGQSGINLGNLGKGIYNVHIQGEGFVQNVKLLVKP
jgi:surface protein